MTAAGRPCAGPFAPQSVPARDRLGAPLPRERPTQPRLNLRDVLQHQPVRGVFVPLLDGVGNEPVRVADLVLRASG